MRPARLHHMQVLPVHSFLLVLSTCLYHMQVLLVHSTCCKVQHKVAPRAIVSQACPACAFHLLRNKAWICDVCLQDAHS